MKTRIEPAYNWEDGDGNEVIYCIATKNFLGYDITRNQIKRIFAGKKVNLPAWVIDCIKADYAKGKFK